MNVKFKGTPVTLSGNSVNVGDNAPSVCLKTKDLGTYQVGGKKDKIQIINVVPSLDTPVCALQAKTFNQKAANLPDVEISVVSMDLPFAQDKFCSTQGIKNINTLSDFKDKEFGKQYGLLINDSPLAGLLARAIIIVNKEGKVIYKEVCDEITSEPNYDAALNALK
ncbi:lipid hydroperoxide peroxidase [Helicobacter sp. 16-1353]|uniref:thiol peroxidase n=1 Tax=Helicobacter sp. 16-1353 TaxID=2004996 RepID=UPI000DCC6C07|nr:thiol peroxidase [Helicobacter sp. 16-1353]RAX55208.1 lipid hydroperoxide peroxidase [Helicobacter sp. 16-1353]